MWCLIKKRPRARTITSPVRRWRDFYPTRGRLQSENSSALNAITLSWWWKTGQVTETERVLIESLEDVVVMKQPVFGHLLEQTADNTELLKRYICHLIWDCGRTLGWTLRSCLMSNKARFWFDLRVHCLHDERTLGNDIPLQTYINVLISVFWLDNHWNNYLITLTITYPQVPRMVLWFVSVWLSTVKTHNRINHPVGIQHLTCIS